mmetsp:Transcript_51367/g.102036  ORF Transcript_51367/g.102036 Transcript_51367/m.102036 type:complete len:160 (+) Transcript_51367:11-490(+)
MARATIPNTGIAIFCIRLTLPLRSIVASAVTDFRRPAPTTNAGIRQPHWGKRHQWAPPADISGGHWQQVLNMGIEERVATVGTWGTRSWQAAAACARRWRTVRAVAASSARAKATAKGRCLYRAHRNRHKWLQAVLHSVSLLQQSLPLQTFALNKSLMP